jgi:hypothetical protein
MGRNVQTQPTVLPFASPQIGAWCPWPRVQGWSTLGGMNTKSERSGDVVAGGLIVLGAGLAFTDVSLGIGWGVILAGLALAVQPRASWR